jgi:hypothetical protein
MEHLVRSGEAPGAKDQRASGIQIENLRILAHQMGLSPGHVVEALEIAKYDPGRAEQFIHNHTGGNY